MSRLSVTPRLRSRTLMAVAACLALPLVARADGGAAAKMPAFLDQSRFAEIEAARAALQSVLDARQPTLVRFDRDEAAKLISSSGEVQRRAEEERALAAEVRARAEALSQRFAAEATEPAPAKSAAAITTGSITPAAKASGNGVEPRTAAAMQRAAEALVRARRDLEEATKRADAASQNKGSPSWQKAAVEIDEARRRASEAVEQAQRAIDEQKQLSADIAANAETTTGNDKRRDPRMVPPFALGGMTR